jgi:hypothetical protein
MGFALTENLSMRMTRTAVSDAGEERKWPDESDK